MKSNEELLKSVGSFGFFQKRALLAIYCTILVSASTLMTCNVFVYYTPPHRCYIPELDDKNSSMNYLPSGTSGSNSSAAEKDLLHYIPVEDTLDGKPKWSQCYRYDYSLPSNISYNKTTRHSRNKIKCDKGWKYDTLPGLTSAVTEFNLVCDLAWFAPLASSFQMIGFLLGAIAGGFLSDRYGRRLVLFVAWGIFCVFNMLVSVVPVWEMYYVFWLLIGLASAMRASTAFVLLNELTPQRYRIAAGFVYNVLAAVCYMLTPMVNYFLINWRHFMGLYTCIQFLIFIPLLCWIKESLHWLLQNGKFEEADALLKEIAKVNRKNINFEEEKFVCHEEVVGKESKEKEACQRKLSYVHLMSVSFLRKRIIIFGLAWFAATLGYFGVSLNTNNLGDNRYISSVISGAVEIPGYVICFISMRQLGGKLSYMVMTGIGGLCLLVTPFLLELNVLWPVTACSMIGKLFVSGSFANVYIFTGDLFPTLLRNQSYGASSFIARLASALIPFILYIGETYHKAIPYLIMGSIAMFASTAMCFLPETRKTNLPDTIEDAKEQERHQPGCLCFNRSSSRDEAI